MNKIHSIFLAVAAGLLMVSCGSDGEDVGAEEISLSPDVIEAKAAMASHIINVTSNTKWTVALQGENNEDVYWATLDRSAGHDNSSVTIRVNENKYKNTRSAKVVFKTAGGKEISASLNQLGSNTGTDTPTEISVRMGSYNLRMSNLDTDDNDNKWSVRKDRLKESIIKCDFDVFGIQEVSSEMQTWLNTEFGATYTLLYFSPYSQNGNGNKAQGIAVRKSAFSTSDWHFFWASTTPETMSTTDVGTQGNFNRGGCCCVVTHKETGIKFFFMNNHACLNSEPNATFASVYIDQEKKFNPLGLPSFYVGDMNARPEYAATTTYKTYWKDSYETAKKKTGASASYNGFANTSGKYRIDYIFHRGEGIIVEDFCIDNTLYGGKYASDHFPLIANIKITK